MFQLILFEDPISQSVVPYTSDNGQGVSKSSLLFSSSKASSPDISSSCKELLTQHFLDVGQPPPHRAWEASGPHGHSGRVGFPANSGASLQGVIWVNCHELKNQRGTKAGPFVPHCTTLQSLSDHL